jgi:hypothetical protein
MIAAGGGGAYGGGGGGGEGGGWGGWSGWGGWGRGVDGGGGGKGHGDKPVHCWVIGTGHVPGLDTLHTSNASIGAWIRIRPHP